MKRSLIHCVILFTYALVFTDCEKEEEPVPFLLVNIARASEGKWIFATNEKGELLDIVQVGTLNRGLHQFETNKPFKSIDLSYVDAFYNQHGALTFYGTTYRNVPTAQIVDAGYAPLGDLGSSAYLGTFELTVNNYPGSLQDLMGATWRGQISPNDIVLQAQRITVKTVVQENSKWIILTAMRQGTPVYYRTDLQSGDVKREIDFSEFLPMYNVQTFSNSSSVGVSGINTTTGYRMPILFLSKNNSDGLTPLTIGTVPGFGRYMTFVSKQNQSYLKVGAPLSATDNAEAKFESYTLDVTDRNLKTFSFNTSAVYDYKSSGSSIVDGLVNGSWQVYASKGDEARMLFEIPQQIIDGFPEMKRNYDFSQSFVTLYLNKSPDHARTYFHFLNEQLSFEYQPAYEQLALHR